MLGILLGIALLFNKITTQTHCLISKILYKQDEDEDEGEDEDEEQESFSLQDYC